MSFGNSAFGTHALATGGPSALVPNPIVWSTERPAILFPESPLIELYKITSKSGNIKRIVNFGDKEASTTPGQVTFDGAEWITCRVTRTAIASAADGSTAEITLGVGDHDRSIAGWAADNDGLVGASVTMYLIAYEDLGTPALATSRTFRISRAQATSGPSAYSVTIAAPGLGKFKYPSILFSRDRCINIWPDRFTHNWKNYCPYPSDEFMLPTRQIFDTSVSAETEGDHGWYAINANICNFLNTGGYSLAGGAIERVLYCAGDNSVTNALWDGSTRNGAFVYKKIPACADLSFSAKIHCFTAGAADAICGLCVQSQADPSTWVFFGVQNVNGTPRYLGRRAISGVGTDYTTAGSYKGFKLTRSSADPDDWLTYVSDQDRTIIQKEEDITWSTGVGTITVDVGTGALNVGIVFALDETDAGLIDFSFDVYHCRFYTGGLTTCDGTYVDCLERKNSQFFNAFMGMPDDVYSPYRN